MNRLRLSIIINKIEILTKFEILDTLNDLEIYLNVTGFLKRFIPFHKQKAEPLKDRKILILKTGRKDGTLPIGKLKAIRKNSISKAKFIPTK